MTSAIEELWRDENLPIQDGLYRADGTAYGIEADASVPGGLRILDPISVEDFLSREPDMVTSIDVTAKKLLDRDAGYAFCGEGSYGSEGFFGQLDRDGNLAWVVYMEESNPFVEVAVDGDEIAFRSSSGVFVTVNLKSPEFLAERRGNETGADESNPTNEGLD